MSQVTFTRDTLKDIFNADSTADVQSIILDLVPDLMQTKGFVLNNIDYTDLHLFTETFGVDKHNDTDLIEVINRTASGDEAGKGFYLHRQGGNVTWYASPTKKGKAVRLVPVYTGTDAEQHLIELGYTAL